MLQLESVRLVFSCVITFLPCSTAVKQGALLEFILNPDTSHCIMMRRGTDRGSLEEDCSINIGVQYRPLWRRVWFSAGHAVSLPTYQLHWNPVCRFQQLQVPIRHFLKFLNNVGFRFFFFLAFGWSEEEIFGRHYCRNLGTNVDCIAFMTRLVQRSFFTAGLSRNKYVCSRTLTSHTRQTSGHKVKADTKTTPPDNKCTVHG